MSDFFKTWVKAHITECEKVTERNSGEHTFYAYHATEDDREYADSQYDSLDDYMVNAVSDELVTIFQKRNPNYVREHPETCVIEEIVWAVGELNGEGALYVADPEPEPLKVVSEYHGGDGETYVIAKDGRGYCAIKKSDIQDGKVTRAYTGVEACATDTVEETLKILRGRIYTNGLKEQGLPESEIIKKSVEWWNQN